MKKAYTPPDPEKENIIWIDPETGWMVATRPATKTYALKALYLLKHPPKIIADELTKIKLKDF